MEALKGTTWWQTTLPTMADFFIQSMLIVFRPYNLKATHNLKIGAWVIAYERELNSNLK
jgi:hypothetical protein